MGEGRVGSPVLLDTYRPEAFEMRRFEVDDTSRRVRSRVAGAAGMAGLTAVAAVADISPIAVAAVRPIASASSAAGPPIHVRDGHAVGRRVGLDIR